MWCASAPLPPNMDEYLLAGYLNEAPVPFVVCVSQSLEVPAQAEIVIEGYADEPTADERYVVARHRAAAVRDYLVTRFTLDSNRVGLIALGNEPPEAAAPPDGMTLRGVALALYVPR